MNRQEEFLALRRRIIEREFSRMNDRQREAVLHIDGPLLILAGAGSGKTTVVVNRIAHLVKYGHGYVVDRCPEDLSEADMACLRACAQGIQPVDERVVALCAEDPCPAWRILAITFTNKAAGELRERLEQMLGECGADVAAGTFHSFCARLLRREGQCLGYSAHFTIYDTDDSRRLMKQCLKEAGIEEKMLPVKTVLSEIGRAKDSLVSPDEYEQQTSSDPRLKMVARCYSLYQRRLQEADAMDFDDLINKTVQLFERFPEVLARYQNRFHYIMVDEYQDTNYAQYRLVSLLAARHHNLGVVGDDDQSIYKFRGATVENILSFEKQFSPCKVIRLEQNYRSTQTILDAANQVIAKNKNRKVKTLWTQNPAGEKIEVHTLDNEEEEARFIADTVLTGVAKGRSYRDFALLYRARAQSNALERAFVKSGIPYRMVGGHRFYDTQEVRDAMAYLRILQNPADSVSLMRIINVPKRGIGATTMETALRIADGLGETLYEVLCHAADYPELNRAAVRIKEFVDVIAPLAAMAAQEETVPHELYRTMLENTGYLAMWQQAGPEEADRVENLNELASSLLDYEKNSEEAFPSLAGFLEEAALMTDADNYDSGADSVVMMTMHAAKGLEFPVVFLPGFEDGVFPGMLHLFDEGEMEEERRLCYVAITRAKEQLYISHALCRMLFGKTERHAPSCFLKDIDDKLLKFSRPAASFSGRASGLRETHGETGWHYSTGERSSAARQGGTSGRFSGAATSDLPRSQGISRPSSPAETAVAVQVGDRVKHKTFGVGRITEAKPMGNDVLLTVSFETVGVKKIMQNFAKLELAP